MTCDEDLALDDQRLKIFRGCGVEDCSVVGIDHALNLGDFDNWVQGVCEFCDLNDVCCELLR